MNKSSDNVNNVSIFFYSETLHICIFVEIANNSSSTFAKPPKSFLNIVNIFQGLLRMMMMMDLLVLRGHTGVARVAWEP